MSERQRHQHGADGSPFGEVAAEPMADEVTEEGMDVDDVTAVARQRSLSRPESSRSLERRNSLLFRGQPSYIPPPTPDMSKLSRVLTQVFVWGRNDLGQLGMGNDTNLAQPTPCGALQNKGIVHITASTFHTAAVSEDGDVWVFGANDSGQLGQRNGDMQLRPRRVAALEMHSVSHLAAGLSHSLAVTEKGQLLSWGAAEFGQLGQGADTDASVRVPKLVRGLQNPHLVRVAAGEAHSVFLDASGHVWSCGQGLFGALGHGSEEPLLQPKPVRALWNVAVVQVDCGNHHSAALALDGAIYTWGRGRYGALGLGNLENCYTPTKVRGVEGQHPLQLSCGNDHMLLLTKAGAVWSWGRGTWGQTGLGSVDDVCRPRRVPSLVDETVVQVSAGGRHSLMITRAGAVLACGCAEFGQLGPGVTQPFVATPRRVQQLPPGPPLFVVAGGDHCLLSVQEVHGRRALPPGPSAGQPYGLSLMALAELDLEGGIRSAASSPSEALRQERSLLLASVVGSVFSSPALIRHHFRRDAALAADLRAAPRAAGRCAQDHGLSLAAVSCTYTRLLKLYNVEIVEALCHAGTTALESAVAMLTESLQDQALQDSWLPALLVMSLNPVNGDSSGRGAVLMSLLNSVASLLTRRSRDTLAAWCAEVSKQHFSAYMLQPVQRNLTALVQDPHVLQEPLNVAGRKDLMKALSFMAVLHDANRLRRADAQLQFSDFYNSAVNATCNLQLEYILWRHRNYTQHVDSPLELYEPHMHRLSLCAFPFVLNALSKSRMMQGEAREMQNHAVRAGLDEQVIVQAMLHGVNPLAAAGFLDLRIRRENVLGDTLNQVASRPGDLSKPLRITFISNGVDEEGQDEGGVSKEFFMLLVRELFNPAFGMFTYDDQSRTFWFNQSSLETTREFQLVGSVMGLALYNGIILDVHFPLVVYKKLKGEAVGLADLEDFKPDVAKSFAQLLQYDGDVEKDLCLTFTVEYDYFGEKRTHELRPGGGSIAVSRANREEYVQLYCRYILEGSIAAQFNNFRDGFFRVVRGRTMHLFSHLELELLVCGLPHLDFKELEMNSRLDGGYSPDTPVVRWLWQVVHSFTIQQKKHFLLFTTGCDRAPVGGLKELRLVVQRSGPDTDRLPTSHTCFHVLLLPEYRSLEKLRRLLLMAIENAEGFGLK